MSELHQRIMNLPCHAPYEAGEQLAARVVYREGHRDARHAAAELANEADAEISRLRDTQRVLVEALRGLVVEVREKARHGHPASKYWDSVRVADAALASVEQPQSDPAQPSEEAAMARDAQFETLWRALEVIAVGCSANPVADAAEALRDAGVWRKDAAMQEPKP